MDLARHNLEGHLRHLHRLKRMVDGVPANAWTEGIGAALDRAEQEYLDLGPVGEGDYE